MADKQFPASEQKLQRLREEGIIPLSRDLTTAGLVAGLLLLWLLFPWYRLLGLSQDAFDFKFRDLSVYLKSLPDFLFPILECLGVCVLLFWLVQTRFYFRFGRKRPDEPFFGGKLFGTACASTLKSVIWGALVFFLFWPEVRDIGGEFHYKAGKELSAETTKVFEHCAVLREDAVCATRKLLKPAVSSSLEILFAVGGAAAIASFLLGILSRFMAGLVYQHEHRMTRGEVEAEAREGESPRATREMLEADEWPEISEN